MLRKILSVILLFSLIGVSSGQETADLPELLKARAAYEREFIQKVSVLQEKYGKALDTYQRNFTRERDLVSAREAAKEGKLAKNWKTVPVEAEQRTLRNEQLQVLYSSYERAVLEVLPAIIDRYQSELERLAKVFASGGDLKATSQIERELAQVRSRKVLPVEAAVRERNRGYSRAEFEQWLTENVVEFTGKFAGRVVMTFDGAKVKYAQPAKEEAKFFEYKVESSRSISIAGAGWTVTFSKDLASGTFKTPDRTYPVKISEKA